MSENELMAWVLRRLGAPQVKVELGPADLADAIEDAKDYFVGWVGKKRIAQIQAVSGKVDYEMPPDTETVLKVILSAPPFDLGIIYSPYLLQDEKIPYDVFAAPESGGVYSTLLQSIQYSEMAKRILSADDDWIYQEHNNKLILSPAPNDESVILVAYSSNQLVLSDMTFQEYTLFKRYVKAHCKEKLGRVYVKYESFPGAQGDRRLNGQSLVQEGQEEMREVRERLRRINYPAQFISG